MSDRPASLLTNTQRKYLQGEAEPSNVSQTEGRMYDRIEQGLFDFYILFEYLTDKQLENIFGTQFAKKIEPHKEAQGNIPSQPASALYVDFAIAFFLRGLNDGDEDIIPGWEEKTGQQQPAFRHFTEAIERGVKRYVREKQGYHADVDVTIELSNVENELIAEFDEDKESDE